MADLSKQEEKALLLKLKNGNGYFAERFGEDVAVMVKNIDNDFSIECGTSLEKFETELSEEKATRTALENQVLRLNRKIELMQQSIDSLKDSRQKTLEEGLKAMQESRVFDIEHFYSQRQVLKTKLNLRLELRDGEIDILTQLINQQL